MWHILALLLKWTSEEFPVYETFFPLNKHLFETHFCVNLTDSVMKITSIQLMVFLAKCLEFFLRKCYNERSVSGFNQHSHWTAHQILLKPSQTIYGQIWIFGHFNVLRKSWEESFPHPSCRPEPVFTERFVLSQDR